jgi:ABC-2 type transport system permease protein
MTMTRLLGNEVLKLRTVRSPWLLLAIGQVLVVAGISAVVISGNDLSQPDIQVGAIGHVGLMSLLTLILGITAVAGEHRNQTVTDTYLGAPRRGQVVAAKLLVYSATGIGFGLLNLLTALAATQLWCWAKGFSFDLGNDELWRTAAGGVLWSGTFAAIGVGVGALLRNLTGAVAVALAWLALVEGILAQLIGDLGRWLPYASGTALNHLPSASTGAPQWGAALVLVGYAAVFAIVAISTTVRRDVT